MPQRGSNLGIRLLKFWRKLGDISGEFVTGEAIVGQASGAAYANIDLNKFNLPEDGFAQNDTIEKQTLFLTLVSRIHLVIRRR